MKKNLLLYILLVFLIIVNGFFLYNYLGKPNVITGEESSKGMNFVIKQLDFNEDQIKQLEGIDDKHHEKMKGFSNEIRGLKDALFSNISVETLNKKEVDSIISRIALKESEKEKEVFYHFRSIHELCNDKQKAKFKTIINQALGNGGENRPPQQGMERNGPRPPRDGEMRDGPPPRP
ncbi:Spy/CpxP family protein refolding chaperone [Mariniflexile sp.]|uniref:Spy/CpxP family protein refolding chaperone n=1 Tax=Mariniflexile sp. TaxID=1979402 RepID=UPI00356416B8